MDWIEFSDRSALTDGVCQRVHEQVADGLNARSSVFMALSGGSTPMPIYARLARTGLDWSRVTAVPTDERWVPIEHAASNAGQISRQFAGSGLEVKSLVPDAALGDADPRHAEHVLSGLATPFDLVMLGMGADAHFASLFPRSPALEAGLDPRSAVDALALVPDPLPPEAPFARISLSLAKLLKTRCLMLVITGEAKREALLQAAQTAADERRLPVAALIRAAGQQLEIFWSP